MNKKEPLVLSVIPEMTKRHNFLNKTFRSRDIKSKGTNETSYTRHGSFRR